MCTIFFWIFLAILHDILKLIVYDDEHSSIDSMLRLCASVRRPDASVHSEMVLMASTYRQPFDRRLAIRSGMLLSFLLFFYLQLFYYNNKDFGI